ncbi:T9SS type A sorting domain-containing protein [Flavihumibacter petaseus]|nr:T9SS type A sorting domain-containing protein [Flavihumibacter petaseus]
MKNLYILASILLLSLTASQGQITAAINRANFGVDGEVRTNFLGAAPQFAASSHDWFANTLTGLDGKPSRFMIDTTGAGFITSQYVTNANFRKLPFFRTMNYSPFSVLDNRLLIDAVYIRDYHGMDSTAFAISNKNGNSPSDWNTAVETNIPDKNDILDMYVHVRRAGPQAILSDSLWFIGGIALDATNGNRYFDFEMYQTDIFYNRQTRKFTGTGPDAGHTTWKFSPTTGAVTTPGDVIFTAEYSGGGLQNLEARIWVDRAALSINSPNFDWTGSFDGDKSTSQFGYAGVKPKVSAIFYSGLQNASATWAGPFQLVRANNNVQTTFDANQFLEFSVNMTRLGLDPISLLGGNACSMPFRRILVKTRSSSSFTAELKDFVGPFDFFNFKAVDLGTDLPTLCGPMTSTISVTNPMPTSTYTWETPDGHIVGTTSGPQIAVDTPGTYIVKQRLLDGCGEYAADTMLIIKTPGCVLLPANRLSLTGRLEGTEANLNLAVSSNENVLSLELEKSTDGNVYTAVKTQRARLQDGLMNYTFEDGTAMENGNVYYRVKVTRQDGSIVYSEVVRFRLGKASTLKAFLYPNPVVSNPQISIQSDKKQFASVKIFSSTGALVKQQQVNLIAGESRMTLTGVEQLSKGVYMIAISTETEATVLKMVKAPAKK